MKVAEAKQKCVVHQLNLEKARQDAENQNILRSIVQTLILCGRQELALRGKHDSGNVMSQDIHIDDGNFRALLRFCMQSGDLVLEKHLESGPRNVQFTSPTIVERVMNMKHVSNQ